MFKLLLYVWVAQGGVTLHEVALYKGVKECQQAGDTITITAHVGAGPTPVWGYFCVPSQ
jgi:hypothetical protein